MTSSQSIALSVVFGFGLGFVSVAWADSASDACAALANARTALYSMINAKDKSAQDALNAKVQEASTKLESVLASVTGANAKAAADFRRSGISSRRREITRSYRRSIRATPTRRRRLPTASNSSACPRCGASCLAGKMNCAPPWTKRQGPALTVMGILP